MVQNARVFGHAAFVLFRGYKLFVGPTVNRRKTKEQITSNVSYEVRNTFLLANTAELLK